MKKDDQKERDSFLSSLDSYLERGLDQMAMSQTIERLNRFPFDTELKMTYCDILTRMGRDDDAAKIIGELKDTFIKLSKIYAHMGDIYVRKGRLQEAVSSYKKFLYLNPGSSKAHEIRQILNSILNSPKMEIEEGDEDGHQDVKQIAPHFRTMTMAELYIRQGHLDMAADILKEILKNEPDNKIAADRLQQITNPRNDDPVNQGKQKNWRLIAELEKWLKNIKRIKTYAT